MVTVLNRSHVRQAVSTRYRGPTNTRGSRIIAQAEAGRMSFPYDHALDLYANHAAAAAAFAERWGWDGEYVGGGTQDGYCFVRVVSDT